ncbi:MAG: UDP-N-acetylglucosamine 1-carboxyvinyltransferase [Lachnoclostridium sp.]|nr:UDP-N-acetylglucosamine 1-carboxyvinyltransferase [Lachnoclostridium sp.]
MTTIEMEGGSPLHGEIVLQGSKNAVLPMMAGSLLCSGITVIHNCPVIDDVMCMIKLLKRLGCPTKLEGHTLTIDTSEVIPDTLEEDMVKELRASVLFLGSLIGRTGCADLCFPGGCSIGERPIDFHLKAFDKMGIDIQISDEWINCKAIQLNGAKIVLEFPSVGATENIILAAVLANGMTQIINAAKEPEIVDLCCFLRKMGAKIYGAGTDHIVIYGVKKMRAVEYTVCDDRIAMATYGLLIAGTGGHLTLNTKEKQDKNSIRILSRVGCRLSIGRSYISVRQVKRPRAISYIKTRPYPGFPTDAQSLLMSVLSKAKGVSVMEESVFENRLHTVSELNKLGANIGIEGNRVTICGVGELTGRNIVANELRGGAALVIAGLIANGTTRLENTKYIARGYEDFIENLQSIGAKIRRV